MTGLAFGMATATWLRYMYNTPMAEVTLTIIATYGAYIVADELFHVSAVLAVVTLGAQQYEYLVFNMPSSSLDGHQMLTVHKTTCCEQAIWRDQQS